MQKKIIALAVAGLVSGGAFAQSNVTIFGVLDASLVTNSAKGSGMTYGMDSAALSTTYVGFKGTEDLGNGLKAFFNLIEPITLTTGGTGSGASGATTTGYNNFSVAANVGLAGSFGTLMVGRQRTPVFKAVIAGDALTANSGGLIQQWATVNIAGQRSPLTGLTVPLPTNTTGGARLPDSYAGGIGYTTPNLSGFQAEVFVNAGNNITGAPYSDNGMRELGVSYTNGSIYVGWAYDETSGRVAANAVTGVFPGNITESKTNTLGGSYTVGKLRVAAGWYNIKYDASLHATNHDNSAWNLGATYVVAPMTYGVEYTSGKDDTMSSNKDNMLAFLAQYTMSKRTSLYTILATVSNSGEAVMQPIWSAASLSNVGVLDARNGRNTSLVLGIRHTF